MEQICYENMKETARTLKGQSHEWMETLLKTEKLYRQNKEKRVPDVTNS